jgi:hypothetical protein
LQGRRVQRISQTALRETQTMNELSDADWLRAVAAALDAGEPVGHHWSERLRMIADEMDDDDLLRDRMADLLTRTAHALKGEPAALTLHDWSDLPEVAAEAVAKAPREPKP